MSLRVLAFLSNVSILAGVQGRAVQLSQMPLLSRALKEILCAHVKVLWFCEGRAEDATGAGMRGGMHAPPRRSVTKMRND